MARVKQGGNFSDLEGQKKGRKGRLLANFFTRMKRRKTWCEHLTVIISSRKACWMSKQRHPQWQTRMESCKAALLPKPSLARHVTTIPMALYLEIPFPPLPDLCGWCHSGKARGIAGCLKPRRRLLRRCALSKRHVIEEVRQRYGSYHDNHVPKTRSHRYPTAKGRSDQ